MRRPGACVCRQAPLVPEDSLHRPGRPCGVQGPLGRSLRHGSEASLAAWHRLGAGHSVDCSTSGTKPTWTLRSTSVLGRLLRHGGEAWLARWPSGDPVLARQTTGCRTLRPGRPSQATNRNLGNGGGAQVFMGANCDRAGLSCGTSAAPRKQHPGPAPWSTPMGHRVQRYNTRPANLGTLQDSDRKTLNTMGQPGRVSIREVAYACCCVCEPRCMWA